MKLRWYTYETRKWQRQSNRYGEGWYIDSHTPKFELQYFDEEAKTWIDVPKVIEIQDPGLEPQA